MIKKRVKRFEDFTSHHKGKGIGEPNWEMDDIFEMLNYLAKQIESKEILSLKGKKFCPLCKADLPLSRRK